MNKWAFFILLMAMASSAMAAPIQVQVIAYPGLGAMAPSDVYRTLGGAREDFEKAGFDVRFQRIWFVGRDPCSHRRTLSEFPSRVFACYQSQAAFYRSRYGPVLIIAPPLRDGTTNTRWLAGVSSKCRGRIGERVSVAFISVETHEGVDRRYASRIVTSHEVAHALGANHNEQGANIMSQVASTYARNGVTDLKFNDLSKREMSWCLGRR